VAQSSEGAKVLHQAGLLSRLAECTFLDRRPEHDKRAGLVSSDLYTHDQDTSSVLLDSFVPTVVERYRQLLMPALKVSLAMLTSLGSQAHKELASKVIHMGFSAVTMCFLMEITIQLKSPIAFYRFHNEEACYLRYNILLRRSLTCFCNAQNCKGEEKVTFVQETYNIMD